MSDDAPPPWKTIAGVMLGSFVYVVLLDAWRHKATGWDLVDAGVAAVLIGLIVYGRSLWEFLKR